MATKKSTSTSSKKTAKKSSASAKKSAASSKSTGSKKAASKKSSAASVKATKTATKAAAKTSSDKKSTGTAGSDATSTDSGSKAVSAQSSAQSGGPVELPKPRFSKDGLGYTKDFPLAFVKQCYDDLQAERIRLTGQANRLEHEAQQLVEDSEMGDVQFDDEGGEGDTLAVERERDLTLSAQARETVREIDDALTRIAKGTYGYSTQSGRPIPTERLEAIPWSTVLVEEKVGGLGRR